MIQNLRTRVLPEVWADADRLEAFVCRQLGVERQRLGGLRMRHTSIDARQRQVMIQLDVDAYLDEQPPQLHFEPQHYPELPASAPQAVVVGAGPGGLFAALRLIQLGVRPVVLERGRDVATRRRDVAQITRQQCVDPDSNFCFGEGGAGAFSDGKLFTRSKKRGNVQGVLEGLCQFGADTGILDASHPHIGTDRLPGIIARIRQQICQSGGELHFDTAVTELLLADTPAGRKVQGVRTRDGREFLGPVILATGHSARDIYRMLHRQGVRLEAKGLAIGCRLEHPQALIDQIQYHSPQGRGRWLPAAEYSFVAQAQERGVYSFCMCPGGVIVPSATDAEQLVVNGMSASSRGGRWANSAMVTELRVSDLPMLSQQLALDVDMTSPLAMMAVQEAIERRAWTAGGNTQVAPAQRLTDFIARRATTDPLPASSYTPGVVGSNVHDWMPPFIARRMHEALQVFGRRARGFVTAEALLVGAETRTSSPVRIPRDGDTLAHPDVMGLYPCGEGAGFAGGIVSAAMDGQRCAEALHAQM